MAILLNQDHRNKEMDKCLEKCIRGTEDSHFSDLSEDEFYNGDQDQDPLRFRESQAHAIDKLKMMLNMPLK